MSTATTPLVDSAAGLTASIAARRERAEIKERLRCGEYDHRRALEDAVAADGASPLARMRVSDFLETLPFVGQVKRKRMMADLGIWENKRLGGLGPRQNAALWDLLASWLATHPVGGETV